MEQRHRSVLVQSFEEGIRRVENGNYAFLTETPLLEYAIRNNCNFTQVGGLLSNTRAYAIATPKGSTWREPISEAIRSLNANGFLQRLHEKWLLSTNDLTNNSNNNTNDIDNNLNAIDEINNNRTTTVNRTTTTTSTSTPFTSTTNQSFINNKFVIQKSLSPSAPESSTQKLSYNKRRNSLICNQHYSNINEKYQDYNFYSDNDDHIVALNDWRQPVNALHLENVGKYYIPSIPIDYISK